MVTTCLYFVTTDPDFARIEHGWTSNFCRKANFLWEFYIDVGFNELCQNLIIDASKKIFWLQRF